MKFNFSQKIFLISITVLVPVAIIFSCRKLDVGEQMHDNAKIVAKFFKHNANVDPTVEAIIQSIKRQNDKRDFVPRL